jgi:hypothetical protein
MTVWVHGAVCHLGGGQQQHYIQQTQVIMMKQLLHVALGLYQFNFTIYSVQQYKDSYYSSCPCSSSSSRYLRPQNIVQSVRVRFPSVGAEKVELFSNPASWDTLDTRISGP